MKIVCWNVTNFTLGTLVNFKIAKKINTREELKKGYENFPPGNTALKKLRRKNDRGQVIWQTRREFICEVAERGDVFALIEPQTQSYSENKKGGRGELGAVTIETLLNIRAPSQPPTWSLIWREIHGEGMAVFYNTKKVKLAPDHPIKKIEVWISPPGYHTHQRRSGLSIDFVDKTFEYRPFTLVAVHSALQAEEKREKIAKGYARRLFRSLLTDTQLVDTEPDGTQVLRLKEPPYTLTKRDFGKEGPIIAGGDFNTDLDSLKFILLKQALPKDNKREQPPLKQLLHTHKPPITAIVREPEPNECEPPLKDGAPIPPTTTGDNHYDHFVTFSSAGSSFNPKVGVCDLVEGFAREGRGADYVPTAKEKQEAMKLVKKHFGGWTKPDSSKTRHAHFPITLKL